MSKRKLDMVEKSDGIKTNLFNTLDHCKEECSDTLFIKTHMITSIHKILESIKDNVIVNIEFDRNGIHFFSLYHSKTVCVKSLIGLDMFSEFKCDKRICTSLNLNDFAKKVATMNKLKIKVLTFQCDGDDINLTGINDKGPPVKICFKAINSEFETLDLDCVYNSPLRVKSADFAKQLESMPSIFTMYVDMSLCQLVLYGTENNSTTIVPMDISSENMERIKLHPEVSNYRASFVKNNLNAIIKTSKLSEYMSLGLSNDCPLHVDCIISESINMKTENNSNISMFFSPRITDDDDLETSTY